MDLHPGTVLHTPALARWQTSDDLHFALDPEGPNWLSTDARGARILGLLDGRRTLAEVVALAQLSSEPVKNLQDVMGFVHAAARAGLVADAPFTRPNYAGRAAHLGAWRLRELWLHTNDSCNLRCAHCLVSSGPEGGAGLATEALLSAIDQAIELGAERVFFTGGEPFLRKDLFALVDRVATHHGREVVILTNATLVTQERHHRQLERLDRTKVRFQVSIDGATAKDNDPVRGAGSFEKAAAGLRRLAAMGFKTSLTAVPSRGNLASLLELPALARSLGASSLHLMWPHRRGRALSMLDQLPGVDELLRLTRAIRERADAAGVPLDNVESLKLRANGVAGVKHDLGMAGLECPCACPPTASSTPRRRRPTWRRSPSVASTGARCSRSGRDQRWPNSSARPR